MKNDIKHTDASMKMFRAACDWAGDWSGTPPVDYVASTKADRGNVGDLVKKGLIGLMQDGRTNFIVFTPVGKTLAKSLGYNI